MKRGQLAAVMLIVILVAVVAAFLIFSQKRVGMTVFPGAAPATYVPSECKSITIQAKAGPFCAARSDWMIEFKSALKTKCGTACTAQLRAYVPRARTCFIKITCQ